MKKSFLIFMLCTWSTVGNAALVDRGGGFIYDPVLDVTWLQDANINGLGTWADQVAWADGLTATYNGIAFSDWRLPSSFNSDGSGPCTGYSCTGSEMGSLFYDTLGNALGLPFSNAGPFINLQSYVYWSGTEEAVDPATTAWNFSFDNGYQSPFDKSSAYYALAVRDGDVVPLPAAFWLFISGLSLLSWLGRPSAIRN